MGDVYRADDSKLGQSVAGNFSRKIWATSSGDRRTFIETFGLFDRSVTPTCAGCRISAGSGPAVSFHGIHRCRGPELATSTDREATAGQSLQIAEQLRAGLTAAHDLGVPHRDLNPVNTMIDGRGHARIADFGLARLAGGALTGEIAGTPDRAPLSESIGEARLGVAVRWGEVVASASIHRSALTLAFHGCSGSHRWILFALDVSIFVISSARQ